MDPIAHTTPSPSISPAQSKIPPTPTAASLSYSTAPPQPTYSIGPQPLNLPSDILPNDEDPEDEGLKPVTMNFDMYRIANWVGEAHKLLDAAIHNQSVAMIVSEQLEEERVEKEGLKDTSEILKAEMARLRGELRTAKRSALEYKQRGLDHERTVKENRQLREEMVVMKKELEEAKIQEVALQEEREKNAVLQSAVNEGRTAVSELAAARMLNEELKASFEDLRRKSQEKEKTEVDLAGRMVDAKRKIEELEVTNRSFRENARKLQSHLEDQVLQIQMNEIERASLSEQIQNLQRTLEDTSRDYTELKAAEEVSCRTINDLRRAAEVEKAARLQKEGDLKSKHCSAEKMIESLEVQARKTKDEMLSVKKELEDVTRTLGSEREKLAVVEKRLDEKSKLAASMEKTNFWREREKQGFLKSAEEAKYREAGLEKKLQQAEEAKVKDDKRIADLVAQVISVNAEVERERTIAVTAGDLRKEAEVGRESACRRVEVLEERLKDVEGSLAAVVKDRAEMRGLISRLKEAEQEHVNRAQMVKTLLSGPVPSGSLVTGLSESGGLANQTPPSRSQSTVHLPDENNTPLQVGNSNIPLPDIFTPDTNPPTPKESTGSADSRIKLKIKVPQRPAVQEVPTNKRPSEEEDTPLFAKRVSRMKCGVCIPI